MNDKIDPLLLTDKQVAALLSISKNQVWIFAKTPSFPTPIKISPKITRWRYSDLTAYVAALTPNAA